MEPFPEGTDARSETTRNILAKIAAVSDFTARIDSHDQEALHDFPRAKEAADYIAQHYPAYRESMKGKIERLGAPGDCASRACAASADTDLAEVDALESRLTSVLEAMPAFADFDNYIAALDAIRSVQHGLVEVSKRNLHLTEENLILLTRIENISRKIRTTAEEEREARYSARTAPWSGTFEARLDDQLYFPQMTSIAVDRLTVIATGPRLQVPMPEGHPIVAPFTHDAILACTAPFTPKTCTARQEIRARRHAYFAKRHGDLIIPLDFIDVKDLKAYGTAQPFKTIPYVRLAVEYKDEKRIMLDLERRRGTRGAAGLRRITPSQLVYLPELVGPSRRRSRALERGGMWNLEMIGTYEANRITQGEGALVAIIDTGCDYTHQELDGRFDPADPGWNFITGDKDVMDRNGHGTHVAGTVAGMDVGVAPKARLLAFAVLDAEGYGSGADTLAAVDEAISRGVDVINMSLGSEEYSAAFEELCIEACRRGTIVCAAAGNDGSNTYDYPSSYDGVISVAAVDDKKQVADFSNYNDCVDIAAPGVSIMSSVPGGYDWYDGTSMATPHVTGSVALLVAAHGLGKGGLEQAVKDAAEPLAFSNDFVGAGLVRPDSVLQQLGLLLFRRRMMQGSAVRKEAAYA